MSYVATINIPGYSPMDDEPPVFDTARDAWQYLADERKRGEDADETESEYSTTWQELEYLALHAEYGNGHEDWPVDENGCGTVYGPTPGYDGNHDLGLAYSVSWTDEHPTDCGCRECER